METGRICATPFWNESISWSTRDPYFSECFKHLILVIGSCAVLWIVAPFEFVKIYRYQGTPLPWSTLSIAKIVLKALLLVICVMELAKEAYAYTAKIKLGLDGLIAAIAYLITIVLTVVLTLLCKNRGLRSSIALPSFWMISTLTTVIKIYDDIHEVEKSSWVSVVGLVDNSMTFVISLVQLFLSNMTEKATSPYGRELMNYCPLDECSFFSRLTFSWLHRLLVTSVKKTLHPDDLIPLCSEFRSFAVSNRFSEIWNDSEDVREDFISSTNSIEERLGSEYVGIQTDTETIHEPVGKSLITVLLKLSGQYLLISSFFEILYTVLYFLPVFILSLLLNTTEEPKWHFYVYAAALFLVLLLTTIVDSQRKYYGLTSGFKIKTAIMNAVFEKALLSKQSENAETYLKEDSENIFQMICLVTEVWGTPIRIFLGVYLLWSFLGSACFVGVGMGAFLIPITVLISTSVNHFKTNASTSKSDWLDLLSKCLMGMRSLKLYSWEDVLLQKISDLRKTETNNLRKARLLRILYKIILLCSTSMVSLPIFAVFVIMTDSFDMKIIYISFSLIFLLKSPFINILRLLAYFIQGMSSISRIQNFLDGNEVENFSQSYSDSEGRIYLQNATFAWTDNKDYNLKDITLNIGGNCLAAVVGESTSGKSSLLRSLLGEMEKINGVADVKGEVAFVSDNSWIQNTTLEENILFGRHRARTFYHNVLESCDLLQDVENLPQGDETQIGDKGYPLSRNQKLKVDLARAVYQNAKIYLIDDLFRCTDTSTAENIFENVIGHRGILSGKIRIFTTSNTKLLPLVDHIIFLKDGEIAGMGDYSELVNKNEYFAEYLKKDWHPKSSVHRSETCYIPKKDISSENYKYRCDPWYSATGLSFKPEMDSFMQGETMTAPKALLRKVLNYIQLNGYTFAIAALLTAVLANCFEVASLTYWAWYTSEHEEEEKMYTDIYIYAGFILGQLVFCTICGILISYRNTLAIQKFYNWLLNRIIKAPLVTFGTSFVDRVLHSFDRDLQHVDEDIPVGIYMWLVTVFKVPVLLVTIFVHCPILFLLFLYVIGAVYIIQRYYMNSWRQLHYLSTSTRCPLFNFVGNVFQGISNIRASKASAHFVKRFHSKMDAHNKCNFLFLLVSRWLSNSIEIIGSVFIIFVASVVIYEKGQGSYFTGIALVFSLQVPECLITFIYLSSMLDIDLSCLERFTSFSTVKQETEFENQISTPWLKSGSIIIRSLTTAYGEGLYPALNNISIAIRPRERVAVVGKEDSGVFTIQDSIFRIKEIAEGQIFIDNVDICHIELHDLRSKLAIIPQDPFIFNGSLKENLDPEQKYKDEELQLALRKADPESNFTDLSNVIDNNISMEEKYQIALARCFLKSPKIVILEGTENSARGAVHFEKSTVLSFGKSRTLFNYDRIICISSGEIDKVISHQV